MMNYSICSILVFSFLLSVSCEEELSTPINPANCQDCITILPLGDSRVEGGSPEFESYRYELWKQLVESNISVDFVGSREDRASYPTVDSQSFDIDHEGTGGATTNSILEVVNAKVNSENAPQVVLLGIGGNDLTEGQSVDATINNINEIIDYLQQQNNDVVILLEQIAPGLSSFMTDELQATFLAFNEQILTVAADQTDLNANVLVVDMSEGWSDDYMADDVHYNAIGAKVVADRYFDTLEAYFEW